MAKPKAFIRHVNKRSVAQPISVKLSSGKVVYQVALGISIDPQFFDLKSGLVKSSHEDSLRINERIRTECKYFEKAEKQLRGNGLAFTVQHMSIAYHRVKGLQEQTDKYLQTVQQLTYDPDTEDLDEMRAHLNLLLEQADLQRKKIEEKEIELGRYESFLLTHYISKFIKLQSNNFTPATQLIYKNVILNVNQFNRDWRIAEVTEEALNAFQDFLFSKNMMNVTVNMIMSKLKYVMNYFAPRMGVTNGYDLFRVTKKSRPADNTYFLTLEELTAFKDITCKTKRIEAIRDTFLVQCLTGLRISDVRFNKASIKKERDGETYINVVTVKTNQSVTIPLFDAVKGVLVKYDFQLPYVHTSEFNRVLKGLCAKLSVDSMHEEVTYTNTSGHKKIIKQCPKWKMISSHSGRKTFVHLNSIAGVHPRILAGMTGHKDLNVLLNTYMSKSANRRSEVESLRKLLAFG